MFCFLPLWCGPMKEGGRTQQKSRLNLRNRTNGVDKGPWACPNWLHPCRDILILLKMELWSCLEFGEQEEEGIQEAPNRKKHWTFYKLNFKSVPYFICSLKDSQLCFQQQISQTWVEMKTEVYWRGLREAPRRLWGPSKSPALSEPPLHQSPTSSLNYHKSLRLNGSAGLKELCLLPLAYPFGDPSQSAQNSGNLPTTEEKTPPSSLHLVGEYSQCLTKTQRIEINLSK